VRIGRKQSPSAEVDHPARLEARPDPSARGGRVRGLEVFRLDPARESYLYVSPSYRPGHPGPFVMMLHGAGGNSRKAIGRFLGRADSIGAILFAPQSAQSSWDVISGGYGPDVAYIDRALHQLFARYSVDPRRTAVEGFSDGASYALSLGITNGDLFRSIIALSPGFVLPGPRHGDPRIFVAHGRADGVLPFRSSATVIVPRLREAGYDVTFRPHSDGHSPVPRLGEAFEWLSRP
jgi:phospholipase/carboxylesterase